ncbi:MAG: cupin domain-containing protein [Phycisphaerales bacterium]
MSVHDATVFRWSDLPHDSPMPMLRRQRIIGERMMISNVHIDAGCSVPTHAHENEQISCVVSGRVRFGIGEVDSPARREVILGPGEVLLIPANVPHSAVALEATQVLDLFSPPSATTGIDRRG